MEKAVPALWVRLFPFTFLNYINKKLTLMFLRSSLSSENKNATYTHIFLL